MKTLNEKLNALKAKAKNQKIKIMIMGLGSVGCYLLDYLVSMNDEGIELYVVGRSADKMTSDVNIVKVGALIRSQCKTKINVVSDIDFNNVEQLADCLQKIQPDIIVNSSRAYSGLKYGSISWNNIRAYGIWSPLSIKYVKNIMEAHEKSDGNAIVINTSYSDAIIPWLKSAGKNYPDFGSGNVNHLIPRIKYAVAEMLGVGDFWNIDVTYATAHFHDVVISKEGQTENVEQLIKIKYGGKAIDIDINEVFARCKIAMPVDAKRNIMNASSNFEIILAILGAVREGKKYKLHCPGVFGEIGGYPVIVDGSGKTVEAYIDQSDFTLDEMRKKNRQSIYLDGIEDVKDGALIYTDELLEKVNSAFGVKLVKKVSFDKIDETAKFIVKEIIEKYRG